MNALSSRTEMGGREQHLLYKADVRVPSIALKSKTGTQ